MGTTLVVNPGSSSRKYALYSDGVPVLEMRYEDTKTGFEACSTISSGQQTCVSIGKTEFNNSVQEVAEQVDKYLFRESMGILDSIVVRVVAPGTYFQKHQVIDDDFVHQLEEREFKAPLHTPVTLKEIKAIRKYFKYAKIYAASDSAFHGTMPEKARSFSIDKKFAEKHDIYRFGYHGLSVASIVRKIHPLIGVEPEKMIVCHIGSGVSVTAVKNLESVETTMGFSPTSGLPMGSRAGDIESAALLEVMREKHWLPRDAEVFLNSNGGLFGLSNESDIRILLDKKTQNDRVATEALDKFAYEIQKAIASSTISLGGLDVLVLTATAAVRSSELRALILDKLKHLGVRISSDRNSALIGRDGVISARNSDVKVVVMRTDEMGEMEKISHLFGSSG